MDSRFHYTEHADPAGGDQPAVRVYALPAFADNYLWVIAYGEHCLLVDPGDADCIMAALPVLSCTPTAILVTHKHQDHVGGVDALADRFGVPVYAPAGIDGCQATNLVRDGDRVICGSLTFTVMQVPGHTLEHIAWYCADVNPPMAFVGDTLFGGGCGRMFEGTAQQFYDSIARLLDLPDATMVYCAHEYTRANLRFALTVEPHNRQLRARADNANMHQLPTVPFTIGLEKTTNPFCLTAQIGKSHPAMEGLSPVTVFARLRAMKDAL